MHECESRLVHASRYRPRGASPYSVRTASRTTPRAVTAASTGAASLAARSVRKSSKNGRLAPRRRSSGPSGQFPAFKTTSRPSTQSAATAASVRVFARPDHVAGEDECYPAEEHDRHHPVSGARCRHDPRRPSHTATSSIQTDGARNGFLGDGETNPTHACAAVLTLAIALPAPDSGSRAPGGEPNRGRPTCRRGVDCSGRSTRISNSFARPPRAKSTINSRSRGTALAPAKATSSRRGRRCYRRLSSARSSPTRPGFCTLRGTNRRPRMPPAAWSRLKVVRLRKRSVASAVSIRSSFAEFSRFLVPTP